jgi:hypothetical protein
LKSPHLVSPDPTDEFFGFVWKCPEN